MVVVIAERYCCSGSGGKKIKFNLQFCDIFYLVVLVMYLVRCLDEELEGCKHASSQRDDDRWLPGHMYAH